MDSQRPRRRSARSSATQRARREELTAAIVSELAQNEVMYRQAVPVLPIRNAVVLPNMVTPLYIDHVKTRRAIKAAYEGEGVIFAVNQRPVRGSRGAYRVALRHGVSRLRAGERFTLGVIFHDAK